VDLPTSLNALLPQELSELVPGVRAGEARKLVSLAHRCGGLPEVAPPGMRRRVLEQAQARLTVPHLELLDERRSRVDPFVKYAFSSPAGGIVESVRIPLEHPRRFSVCVSSQVGCGVGCTFCGTARLGFRRNLAAWEIVEQVRWVRERLPSGARVHGVVFQGMGEPLANLTDVLRSIRVFWEPSAMAIDANNVTVSTSGGPTRLARLVREEPRIRIALSVGAAIPHKRLQLIPTERNQPLARSVEVLADHTRATRNAPLFAYTLLRDVNDTDEDIEALIELVAGFVERSGVKPRVSLIPYSSLGPDDTYAPSVEGRVAMFRKRIGSCGIPVLRRYSGGVDIAAACGQLGMELAAAGSRDRKSSSVPCRSDPS
jgi:23S rRNA (adenine2503-C2)-methyltransferase